MAGNPVLSLIIKARDQSSGILGRINGALLGITGAGREATGQMGSLTNAITGGIVKAQILGAAFNAVGQSVSFVQNKLMESARLQTENIQNIGTLSALTAISYEEAGEFVESLNVKIAEMGKSLPVAAQDIKSVAGAIQDDLIEAFKTADGVDFKGLESSLVAISSDFAVLGKSANVAAGDVQMGLARFLGGASEAEYGQLNLFQRNNALRNELKRQLGGRDAKSLSIKERVQTLQNVGAKLNTADTKKRLAGSVEGLMSSFTDSLFDPDTGIFGFMKDLDLKTKGNQSAFTSFNAALDELIGENGIFNNLGKLLEAAGINLPDPMLVLKRGLDTFTSALRKVNEALGAAREFFNMGSNLPQVLRSLASYFNINLKQLRSSGANFQRNLIASINQRLAQLAKFVKGTSIRVDFKAVGASVSGFLGSIVDGLFNFVKNIDWNSLVKIIGTLVESAWELTKEFISGVTTTVLPAIQSFIKSVNFASITANVKTVFEKIAEAVNWSISFAGTTALPAIMETARSLDLKAGASVVGAFLDGLFTTTLVAVKSFSANVLPQVLVFVQSIDGQALGTTVASGLALVFTKITNGIAQLVAVVDWETVLQIGGTVLNAAMQSNLPLLISGAVVLGVALVKLVGMATAALGAAISPVGITAQLVVVAFSIGWAIGTAIRNWWIATGGPAVDKWWSETSASVSQGWNNTWATVGLGLRNLITDINNWWTVKSNAIGSWWNGLGNNLNQVWSGIWSNVANSIQSAVNFIGEWWQNATNAIKDKLKQAVTNPFGFGTSENTAEIAPTVGSRYMGQVPSGLGSLMRAAATETQNMPSGAGLVVANTSEAILRPNQLSALMNARRGGVGQINFAPNFNIQGMADPEAIARQTLDMLDFMLQDYVGGQLA